jgi:hypothetical protein
MVRGRRRESRRRVLELCYWLAPDEDAGADAADYIDRGAMPNAVKDVTDAEAQELLAKVTAFRERCSAV